MEIGIAEATRLILAVDEEQAGTVEAGSTIAMLLQR
jgi:hypothetical protein